MSSQTQSRTEETILREEVIEIPPEDVKVPLRELLGYDRNAQIVYTDASEARIRDLSYASNGIRFKTKTDKETTIARGLKKREAIVKAKKKRQPTVERRIYVEVPVVVEKVKVRRVEAKVPKPVLDPDLAAVIETMPKSFQGILKDIAIDPQLNRTIKVLMERGKDFSSPAAAMLAGIAGDVYAREQFDRTLDGEWASRESMPRDTVEEVVIGGGLHAAIYCAVRVGLGAPPPIVLEASPRVGGVFAVSRGPSFYLNSRNRPGPLSIPGEMGSLNFMPGALVQPSELGGAEYQTNDSLAWVIRSTLAMYAKVIPNAVVERVSTSTRRSKSSLYSRVYQVSCKDGRSIHTDRVVWASGLGNPLDPTGLAKSSKRVFTFEQFMAKMDDPFPLRGMNRVAVLGGGDGAKTVIEALTGQGPSRGYSVAALDWPQKIDWYGAPWNNCTDWLAKNRSRYKPIAALLRDPNRPDRPYRVNAKPKAEAYSEGYECVYVNDEPYDAVIVACGSTLQRPGFDGIYNPEYKIIGGRRVGLCAGEQLHVVGPSASIEVSDAENVILRGISENATSIFRYAPRTAALAASFQVPAVEEEVAF